MTSVDSYFNFLCGRPHGAGSPPPVHMHPPDPDPLRVDIINGWPLWRKHKKFPTEIGETCSVLVKIGGGLSNYESRLKKGNQKFSQTVFCFLCVINSALNM